MNVEFTFGWLALKLLGKSLYSNSWSAISELVANGFDAQASNVYVHIDITDRENATIEIMDDGTGMSNAEINTYVKVGYNKRKDPLATEKHDKDHVVMGRKGIGKLAALYLSENYYLLTKSKEETSNWQMEYTETVEDEEERPFLKKVTEDMPSVQTSEWEEIETGTLLILNNVDLSRMGERAFDSLEHKLSNYFSLDSMDNKSIWISVSTGDAIKFKKIKKRIAFKNMAFIQHSEFNSDSLEKKIDSAKGNIMVFQHPKYKDVSYEHTVEYSTFSKEGKFTAIGTYSGRNVEGEKIEKPYKLNGWIGFHSTIKSKIAQRNDPIFTKNKFYNPIQLRLYVRNKLAVENFLNYLNNTQAFVNYIEGEISFDILDDDDFPDIATSNRQSIDEHDGRVELLKSIINPIVDRLISKRTALTRKIDEEEKGVVAKRQNNAKTEFAKKTERELDSISALSSEEKANLVTTITNSIEGESSAKTEYTVFISHSSKDKIFTHFVYKLLRSINVDSSEVFYTSKDNDAQKYQNTTVLAEQVKNSIINESVLPVFFTSPNHKASEFCMFEGGAVWATRSVGDYSILSIEYSDIPVFLTNGKNEFAIFRNNHISLDRETYGFIILLLNRIIEHINSGRRIASKEELRLFAPYSIPDDVVLKREDKTIEDYMDADIKEYWGTYVSPHVAKYIQQHNKDK